MAGRVTSKTDRAHFRRASLATMAEIDIEHLRQWVGRSEERPETLSSERAVSLAATLDREIHLTKGDILPPLWHWAYFVPNTRQSELGADGHPKLGGFMPPVPLPRRMWAGGRLEFRKPLHLGEMAVKRTKVTDVSSKAGKSGPLVFVTLRHEIGTSGTTCIVEEQDLVYRQAENPQASIVKRSTPPEPEIAEPTPADWRERFIPDPTLLFRYSAVTFNAHRIHYDFRYAREEENYPDLMVHGPLTATLLVDSLARHAKGTLKKFRFRAVRPLFCGQEVRICGKRVDRSAYELWSETPNGQASMMASAVMG